MFNVYAFYCTVKSICYGIQNNSYSSLKDGATLAIL